MLEFMTLTMLPIVTAYESELNKKMLTQAQREEGYHFKFNMEAMLRADSATMADVNMKAIRSGYKLINEVRAEKGQESIAGGEYPLVSRDLVSLEYLLKNPNLSGGGEKNAEFEEEREADSAAGGGNAAD